MLKQEFENLIGAEVSQKDYEIVETVYMWHPMALTKQHAACLWMIGNIGLFQELVETAKACQHVDEKINRLRAEANQLNEQLKKISSRFKKYKGENQHGNQCKNHRA